MMERNPVQAKRIIEDEHRSPAAVLYGMLYVVREIRYVGIEPRWLLVARCYASDAPQKQRPKRKRRLGSRRRLGHEP